MKTFILATSLLVIAASGATAADYDTNVGGDLRATAIAINSVNVAAGKNAVAVQASNRVCGTRIGGDARLTAIVVRGVNVAAGNGARAIQGSNQIGRCE